MSKSKKPAPKGGKKAAAPKKGLRAPVKGRQRGEKIAKQSVAEAIAAFETAGYIAPASISGLTDTTATLPLHPTVEEQFDRDASLMQALHDPENQPSQYGTVPMSYLDKPKKPSIWRRFRSAITGLFVSKQFAEANPDTTVRERAD